MQRDSSATERNGVDFVSTSASLVVDGPRLPCRAIENAKGRPSFDRERRRTDSVALDFEMPPGRGPRSGRVQFAVRARLGKQASRFLVYFLRSSTHIAEVLCSIAGEENERKAATPSSGSDASCRRRGIVIHPSSDSFPSIQPSTATKMHIFPRISSSPPSQAKAKRVAGKMLDGRADATKDVNRIPSKRDACWRRWDAVREKKERSGRRRRYRLPSVLKKRSSSRTSFGSSLSLSLEEGKRMWENLLDSLCMYIFFFSFLHCFWEGRGSTVTNERRRTWTRSVVCC